MSRAVGQKSGHHAGVESWGIILSPKEEKITQCVGEVNKIEEDVLRLRIEKWEAQRRIER